MSLTPAQVEARFLLARTTPDPSQRSRILRDLLLEPESLTTRQRFIAESMEDEAALLESAGF